MYMYAYMYISIQRWAVVFVLSHALLRVLLLNLLGIIILSYYHTIMRDKREKSKSAVADGKALWFARTQLGHHVSLLIGSDFIS